MQRAKWHFHYEYLNSLYHSLNEKAIRHTIVLLGFNGHNFDILIFNFYILYNIIYWEYRHWVIIIGWWIWHYLYYFAARTTISRRRDIIFYFYFLFEEAILAYSIFDDRCAFQCHWPSLSMRVITIIYLFLFTESLTSASGGLLCIAMTIISSDDIAISFQAYQNAVTFIAALCDW